MSVSARLITAVVFATLAASVVAGSAHAALVADYRFDGNLESSVGGAPPLTAVGSGSATFQTENVNGTNDCARAFPGGAGLSLATNGLISHDIYSVVMTFRFANASNYGRVFDASRATTDNGLYVRNGKLSYYDNHAGGDHFGTALFAAHTYTNVTMTRDAGGEINIYKDGVHDVTYNDTFGTGVLQSPDYAGRFFIDDLVVKNENSAGAVARIRVYNSELSAGEVATIQGSSQPSSSCPLGQQGTSNDKRPTFTKVHCNYIVATASDTCFAQVGDAGPSPGSPPTGSVKFSSGNGGVFRSNSCVLVPTPASPNVSSCSVEYLPPSSSFPKVAGAYQGSATHSGSTGATTFYILGGLPDGLGVGFGDDPTLGNKTSSPITIGCSAPKAKGSGARAAGITVPYECLVKGQIELEKLKNKTIGKPCDGPMASYADLKDCNPNYYEALEKWERDHNIDEETEKLDEMVKKRSDLFDELQDIMKDFDKTYKETVKGMKASNSVVASRSKAVVLGKTSVRVKPGKQKQVRIKFSRRAKKLLSYPRRLKKLLPGLNLPVNVTIKLSVAKQGKKNAKAKRKTVKRVVPFSVSP